MGKRSSTPQLVMKAAAGEDSEVGLRWGTLGGWLG
jgi:hypothetical protein